jgi:very-short-patch-repair endonuclease
MPSLISPGLDELLDQQHRVLSRSQALDAGLSESAIRVRLDSGRWQQLYRRAYATYSGDPPRLAFLWAAVLSAGPDAVISHQTAAELYQLGRRTQRAIHVAVPEDRHIRRTYRLRPEAPPVIISRSDRIVRARHPALLPPRTRIEETVVDLTQSAPAFDEAFYWLSQACGSRLCTVGMIRGALDRRKKVRYRVELEAALSDVADGAFSLLEYRYVHRVERPHGLPAARRQAPVMLGGSRRYLDNLYEDYRLGVELDGAAAHPVAERWRDIHRDNSLTRLRIEILRYNWSDVTTRRCGVAAEVADVLAQRGWPGPVRRCSPGCRAAS